MKRTFGHHSPKWTKETKEYYQIASENDGKIVYAIDFKTAENAINYAIGRKSTMDQNDNKGLIIVHVKEVTEYADGKFFDKNVRTEIYKRVSLILDGR